MGLFRKFDLETDYTVFFLVLVVLFLVFAILLSRIAPGRKGGKGRGRGGKVDDRFSNRNGELID